MKFSIIIIIIIPIVRPRYLHLKSDKLPINLVWPNKELSPAVFDFIQDIWQWNE